VPPRARRAWADGSDSVLREQEQDARAVEEADPDAMAEAFGDVTQRYSADQLADLARQYYLEHGWPTLEEPHP
jgi:hypothetical protein